MEGLVRAHPSLNKTIKGRSYSTARASLLDLGAIGIWASALELSDNNNNDNDMITGHNKKLPESGGQLMTMGY